jgi:Basic region leucine zipper
MPPSNLQGLNVVHTASNGDYSTDSQDLLDFPAYRDFGAQLDLWTNLAFESDDSFLRKGENRNSENVKPPASDDDDDDEDEAAAKESDLLYPGDAHENVVMGTPLPNQSIAAAVAAQQQQQQLANSVNNGTRAQLQLQPQPNLQTTLDLSSFLASFGIDPFGLRAQQLQQNSTHLPTLAQLLTLPNESAAQAAFAPPAATSSSKQGSQQAQNVPPPAVKRARTTKLSITTSPTPESPTDSITTPVTPSEDKRRRNTAASARFRLKKKEREAALEKRAKELEVKVNELERECEGLRRENGWLKGLVVGVTGGVAQQQVQSGTKRARDDGDGGLDR